MAWRKVWKQRRQGVRQDAWLLRWYDDAGTMRAKTLYGTASEAVEECRRIEQELNEGTLGRRRKIHWLDFCEKFLADLASQRRPRTVEDYKTTLENLTEDYRPKSLDGISASLLRDFVRCRTVGRSPATRNKLIRTLRAIFAWAVPEYLKENPASRIKFSTEPEYDKRTLAADELMMVLRVADLRGQAVIMLGACCGLRREEIAALQWNDIESEVGKVHVRNSAWHTTKSGRQRTVLMPPALIEILAAMRRDSKSRFVFPDIYLSYRELPNENRKEWSQRYQTACRQGLKRAEARELAWRAAESCQHPDRPISPDRLTDMIPRLVKKAGIPHCTLHDLRKTFCTFLAAGGTDALAAQKLAGHSSPAVTAKYYVALTSATLKAQQQLPFWNLKLAETSPNSHSTE
jgi:integrase